MYKLLFSDFDPAHAGVVVRLSDIANIPLSPNNTDYQRFKQDIAEGAELQDADGNVMTAEQVAEFMADLQ